MADYGANVADKTIATVERKLRATYRTAQKELKAKLNDFVQKSAERDRRKRKLLDEGKISKQDYANWKAGQIFQQKQWEAKVKEVAAVMTHSNEQAARIINESRLNVFSENYNFSAFVGEQQVGISFDVYNTQAVARMIKDDPQVLPEWKIDEQKDYEWNYKKVNNIIQQGIIQGESIQDMADRLCRDLSTQNENKMRMFARTVITGAQNAGRQQQMEDAAGMGIKVEKQWIATLDSRTRDWHRDRDGETVPYNKEFSGGLEYPGDPAGEPADVFNCRCTMISVYPDHAAHHERGARRAYAEYEDATGYHRRGYATTNPNVFERWNDNAYRRWLGEKHQQGTIIKPKESIVAKQKTPVVVDYTPDQYDKEYAEYKKKLEEQKKENTQAYNDFTNTIDLLSKEEDEYNRMLRLLNTDISEYENLKTKEQYEAYKKELENQIKNIYDQLESQKRPRIQDFENEAEYNAKYEQWQSQRNALKEKLGSLEPKLLKIQPWSDIEDIRNAKTIGRDEINRRKLENEKKAVEAKRKYDSIMKKSNQLNEQGVKYGCEKTAELMKNQNVKWLTPQRTEKPFDEKAVISKLSGPDKTEGSCASLAFAYVGQKAGFDVVDYRGGTSQSVIADSCFNIIKSVKENGGNVIVGTAKTFVTAGKRALMSVEEGKEYYFDCGSHIAIVRKVGGNLQYLEMQSGYRPNKWYYFDDLGIDGTLKSRFGANKKNISGMDVNSYLIDVDELGKNKRFTKLLGYINTETDKQMKGSGGRER